MGSQNGDGIFTLFTAPPGQQVPLSLTNACHQTLSPYKAPLLIEHSFVGWGLELELK